jgi:hypothetical protein
MQVLKFRTRHKYASGISKTVLLSQKNATNKGRRTTKAKAAAPVALRANIVNGTMEKYITQLLVGLATSGVVFGYSAIRDFDRTLRDNNALLQQLVERGQTIDRMRERNANNP